MGFKEEKIMTKKQTIKLIIVILVLCVAIAGYVLVKKHSEKKEQEDKKEETIYEVTKFNTDDVTSFMYTFNKKTYSLEKKDDKWIYKEDKSVDIDTDQVKSLLDEVSNVTSKVKIENTDDLSQYGLDKPVNVITINLKDTKLTINIGDCNTSSGDYYLSLGDEKDVYTVSSTVATKFNIPATDLVKAKKTKEPETSVTQ